MVNKSAEIIQATIYSTTKIRNIFLGKRTNTREENKTRNENNTKEKKGVHIATHDATQARPPSYLPIAVPLC